MENQSRSSSWIVCFILFAIGGFWYYNNVYKPIEKPQEYSAYVTRTVTNNGEKNIHMLKLK